LESTSSCPFSLILWSQTFSISQTL
jgi:hypothetical protein